MFGISYETWNEICQMYFTLEKGNKKAYLQWFPFSKLSEKDEIYISSQEFFNKYIETASFVLYPGAMYYSDNYLQKADGSFRDSSLLSPILYLVLQSIGKEISKYYASERNSNIDVFYAGSFQDMKAKYKQYYDNFFKSINAYIMECQYFIKTDITSFFPSINLDILIDRIDKRCNIEETIFTPTQLKVLKELLLYCGSGRFPIIENSIASSFFATIVYLDEIDERIYNFINDNINCIKSFKMIRYVDDMYILINSDEDENTLHKVYNQIRNEYSSILKEFGLALNSKKCCIKCKTDINTELKKSLYDEYFNDIRYEIEELFDGKMQAFLYELLTTIQTDYIDIERYNLLIKKYFSYDNIEITPTQVFDSFIYGNNSTLQHLQTVTLICDLINEDISFISLDPKRLSVMIMKTQSSVAIKALLSQLFERSRQRLWNSYDTSIAISYLIQSEFKHIDLLNVLGKNNTALKEYCDYCCTDNFLSVFKEQRMSNYVDIIGTDWKACFLYFMYRVEEERHNTLAEFAFFKNFFDRFTADMAFYYKYTSKGSKPNYNGFYTVKNLKDFYSNIHNSVEIIEQAHKLRNANPLSHSSAELIDNTSTTKDIKDCIGNLRALIDEYIENIKNKKSLYPRE